MADETEGAEGGVDVPEDLGEPIEELRMLDEVPAPGFLSKLIGRLRRRDLSSQMATFGWTGLGVVIIEFMRMVFSIFEHKPRDGGGAD